MSFHPKYESFSRSNFYSSRDENDTIAAVGDSSTNNNLESTPLIGTTESKTGTINSDCGRLSNSTITSDDQRIGYSEKVHRKAVKKGFNFTIMVIGESGLGKSTFINSLFAQELYKDKEYLTASQKISRTTEITKRQIELDERGVKIRLTIIDTPGFNDSIDSTDCWKPIENYIDSTFEQYFKDECGLNRKNIQDNRIHCCLYFVSPYGRGLGQLDLRVIRALQLKINIIPIIAKADSLTQTELKQFKARLVQCIEEEDLKTYRLPVSDSDEEEEVKRLEEEIKAVLPFAIIGSTNKVESEGISKKVRGRKYAWGTAEVDNSNHCDFLKLRTFLLKTHMEDLRDITIDTLYEAYRAQYITDRMSKRNNVMNGNNMVKLNNCNRIHEKTPTNNGQFPRFNQENEMTNSQMDVNSSKFNRFNGSTQRMNEYNGDSISLLNATESTRVTNSPSTPVIKHQTLKGLSKMPTLANPSNRPVVAGN